jgi:hypothetical protein
MNKTSRQAAASRFKYLLMIPPIMLVACGTTNGDDAASMGTGGATTAVGTGGSGAPSGSGGTSSAGVGGASGTGGNVMGTGGDMGSGGATGAGGLDGTGGMMMGTGGVMMGTGGMMMGMGGRMMGMGGRMMGMGGMMMGMGGETGGGGVTGAGGTTSSTGGASCHVAGTLQVVSNGHTAYTIDGVDNPDLTFCRGSTYVFALNAAGHPFYINTVQGTATTNAYTDGVTGNGTMVGDVTFAVPSTAPDTLYYDCSIHAPMTGTIHIVN